LISTPIIISPNWNIDFELMCDVRDYALGAILGKRKLKKKKPCHILFWQGFE